MYKLVNKNNFTEKDYQTFLDNLSLSVEVGMDTETSGLDFFADRLKLIQVRTGSQTFLFDCTTLDREFITRLITDINNADTVCIFHNAKFDVKFIKNHTGVLLEKVFDTQVAEAMLSAGVNDDRYESLLTLVQRYLGIELDKTVRLDFTEDKAFTEEMLQYAALDVQYLSDIKRKQEKQFKELELEKVADLEMSLVPVVAQMELNGIYLNYEKWEKVCDYFEGLLEEESKKVIQIILDKVMGYHPINALAAFNALSIPVKTKKKTLLLESITEPNFIRDSLEQEFNISSPKQLVRGLKACGIEVKSTGEEVLAPLKGNPVIDSLLLCRAYAKKITAYGRNYKDFINPVTGRIHAQANQTGTATGRFSYSRPGLQQIPTDADKDSHAKFYRSCFEAPPGYKLLSVDYNQMEYRYFGAVAKEESIIRSYQEGKDLHTSTAIGILNSLGMHRTEETLQDTERQKYGKTINFSVLYGTTAYGMNKNNPDIPQDEAQRILDAYNKTNPNIHEYIQRIGDEAVKNFQVRTVLGRLRFWEDKKVFDQDWGMRAYTQKVKREAVATSVQGSCADIVKIAMLMIFKANPFGDKLKLILQIHDELLFEVADDVAEEASKFVQDCMEAAEQPFLGGIPAKVNASLAQTWEK